jgi:hypothetical protein
MNLSETLRTIGACDEAREWADSYTSAKKAWNECERGDWMLWLLGKLSGEPESSKRKKLVLCACECAELALPYTKDKRVKKCIDTTRAWANGKSTIEEVIEARFAADAATDAAASAAAAYAANAAASAAAYASAAASAAAYAAANASAAASAAAYASARTKTLKQCADIVRKHYPKTPAVRL